MAAKFTSSLLASASVGAVRDQSGIKRSAKFHTGEDSADDAELGSSQLPKMRRLEVTGTDVDSERFEEDNIYVNPSATETSALILALTKQLKATQALATEFAEYRDKKDTARSSPVAAMPARSKSSTSTIDVEAMDDAALTGSKAVSNRNTKFVFNQSPPFMNRQGAGLCTGIDCNTSKHQGFHNCCACIVLFWPARNFALERSNQ